MNPLVRTGHVDKEYCGAFERLGSESSILPRVNLIMADYVNLIAPKTVPFKTFF